MFARIMTILVAASAEQETIVIDEVCLNALCNVGSHATVQGFQPSTTAPAVMADCGRSLHNV